MYTKAAIATIGSALADVLTSESGVARPDISRSLRVLAFLFLARPGFRAGFQARFPGQVFRPSFQAKFSGKIKALPREAELSRRRLAL
jgi:hypothetical protein